MEAVALWVLRAAVVGQAAAVAKSMARLDLGHLVKEMLVVRVFKLKHLEAQAAAHLLRAQRQAALVLAQMAAQELHRPSLDRQLRMLAAAAAADLAATRRGLAALAEAEPEPAMEQMLLPEQPIRVAAAAALEF
jgi:hypothetical protein